MNEIVEKLKSLGLHAFALCFEAFLGEKSVFVKEISELILQMTEAEVSARMERKVARCIHDAWFIQVQTVEGFDFEYNQSTRRVRKRYLQMLDANIVEKDMGAVFVGDSGLGKTHLSRALGYRMCQRGEKVLFTTCSDMLNKLVASEATKSLLNCVKRYEAPGLLIIDELGYITLNRSSPS